ncbi:MAG TPA: calcium-binding protein, partial [Candidatus Limnocylindrales bacterium]
TTGLDLEGRAALDPIDLSAGLGPVTVNVGAAIADKDPGTEGDQPGEGTAKVGATFTFKRGDDDGIPSNRTYSFLGTQSFFTSAGGLEADFQGVDQDCGGSTSGSTDDDACLVADVGVEPTPTFAGTLTVSCDIQPLPAAPTCSATPSGALTALSAAVNGDPLNWSMLIQILPHLLADLEHSLSGAAQDVKLPLAGETLDAGADVVDTFNNGVVIPFASLSAQITNAVDAAPTGDGDGVAEPEEVAKVLEKAIFDLIGPAGSVQLGGAPANLILDLNGDGQRTVADVVVIPRCGSPAPGPCEGAEGDSIEDIDDLRIVVWIGQGIDTQVPFDLGLDGVPLSLKGGLHAGGSWSYLIDFGFSREGPYLVKSGKKTTLNDPATMKVNRPADVPADPDGNDDGVEDDPVPAQWIDQPYLEDDDAGFPAFAEVGMTLRRLPRTGSEEARCTITKVEADKLWCDDFSTSAVEGITWHFDPDDDASTDRYEVLALHAPDTGQDGGAPELLLTAELGLGDQPSACTNDPDALPGDVPGLETGYSTSRCIEAKVAFLTATARDRETGDADCGPNRANFASGLDPTTLCLTAFMDVTSTGTDPRITLANLGKADLTLGFTVDANVDVRFRTGIGTGPDFPSVVGAFHMYWGFTASTETAPAPTSLAVGFDQLHLDAGAFVGRFLAPTVKGIQHVTKPLQPVIETLQGEVPIVSDLSKLVGEGPVTMLDLLEAISDNDLSAVRSILQLIRFVNALPTDNSGLLIPLGNSPGAFDISPTRALGPQPTPDQAGSGITPTSAGTNLTDQLGSIGAGAASDECVGRGATFGVCGLTFPFLANASEIFGVLMGKDTTLVHYDAGTLKASAGFGYCFPPITIGPIPVQICLGGSFTVEGRFAMGYDTSGLRKVLDGGSGVALLDGIFIDDYDAAGKEVAEIKFTGTVYAEGAASLLIFKVGIRGEIIFLTTLDLDDRPNPDGKLRIEEIVNRLSNPICLFVVSGQIDAALSAFVEIDLFFFTKRFSIEIVRITLLKFEVKCEPEVPNLADVVDGSGNVITDPATAGTRLVLNVGNTGGGFQDRRDERNIQEDAIDETLVVRQMEDVTTGPNAGRTRFSISGFGIKEDEYLLSSAVHAGTAVVEAYGHDGDDNFSFLAGGGNEGTKTDAAEVDLKEFEPKVLVRAGIGNDEVTSGNGADDIEGGANDDRIISGTGADRIRGGDGNDSIDAGEGNDTDVQGGPNDDTINGGPGGDNLQGNGGDDNISAGPDEPSATSVDVLIGGAGNDNLAGDGGDDDLYGDEVITTCTADGVDTGNTEDGDPNDDNIDSLIGGTGNDYLHGGAGRDQLEGNDGADELCGGGFHDEIVGGNGKDTAEGGSGDDDITGGTDDSPAANGGDVLRGGPGRDYVLGDEGVLQRDLTNNHVTVTLTGSFPGNDVIEGGPGDDFLWGQGGSDLMDGDDDDDELRGGADVDTMNGDADDDELYGDDGDDVMHGDAGNDYMRGGVGADTMDGDDDTDEMYGDNDRDVMRGGPADDLMRGGSGDDDLEGNGNTSSALPLDDAASPLAAANFDLQLVPAAGNEYDVGGGGDGDVVYGDAGQDDIIGGSRGASPPADRGDTILGNAGQDVVVGDNGVITRPVGTDADGTTSRVVTLTDPGGAAVAQSDGDWIQGNEENDDVYAGGGGDLVHGDLGDDYVEGNGGGDGDADADTTPDPAIGLYGDTGHDDLIGGTSQGSGGVADGADDVWGGSGADVIAGDNATITRGAGTDCPAEPHPSAGYDCNTFRVPDAADVVIRRARIWDVATTAAGAPAGTSGGDSLGGQEGHDRLYGQGGDDRIEGGAADDFAFGNDGSDTIFGGDGQDDLIGGTGRTDSAAAASAADGRLDGADEIHGEADFDAIAGDNARMVRATTGADDDHGLWVANTFNDAVDRLIALMDVGVVGAAAGGGTSGNDELLGGGADDLVYGQGGNDGISGGDGQDIVEGNANGTGDAPDPADTYGGAWPAFAGDVIHGDAGADDIAGGTGWIYRIVGGLETADPIAADVRVGADGRLDAGDRLFGDDGGDALAGDNTVIERALEGGEWILDDLRDPDALDVVRRIMRQRDVATTAQQAPLTDGTSGGDVISGDGGVDVAYGQGGDDEITGDAGDDHLEGNAGDDVVLGGEGQDDLVGGTGRTFSNDEATAAAGRIDESDTADANDVIAGGDGAGGVAADDDDVVIGDNGTVDRQLGQPIPTPDKLPFNGTWQATSWDEPAIRRVVRLLDIAVTGSAGPEADGTNGADTIDGEANDDLLFGQGGGDAIHGDDADLDAASAADASPGDDYVEGNGGADTIRGDLGQDDVTGGGSAANGVLDANRDGRLDDERSGETLRDLGDTVDGDSGDAAVGAGDVVAGDNARIQRLLDGAGDWRTDAARGTVVRDVFLFDVQKVDGVGGFTADPGESAADVIAGNGGNDILLGQGNGAVADAYGT